MHPVGKLLLVAIGVVTVSLWSAGSADALAVTAPSSTTIGTTPTGAGSLSAQLGTITATNTGIVAPSVTAQVSCTGFTTGAATPNETIPCSAVTYWSGPPTAQSGLLSNTPGQADAAHAVTLASTRTAFSATGLLLNISVSWNPTLIITLPSSAVAGTYSGTITHSVA